VSDIETRVRDAIAMNVDLMEGQSRIVERALASVGQVRRRRRRRRALVSALVVTAGVGIVAGIAAATRDHDSEVTVTAGSSTSVGTVPRPTAALSPSALVAGWNPACGSVPKLATVGGLRFTLSLPSTVVAPGETLTAVSVLRNATDHEIQFGTGVGAWYITTPSGRLVGTSSGYPVYTIGYRVVVPAHGRVAPHALGAVVAAVVAACAPSSASPASPQISPPLPRGKYLAWYGLPIGPSYGEFVSEPAPIEVGGAPVWNVPTTRAQALTLGRRDAIDPSTTVVMAKLASWAEIQGAGAYFGTSPTDNPDRRIWVVSIAGPPHPGHCCIAPHKPFRWGVVLIDANTGDGFSFAAGSTGDVAPWFARLPDHGA
jgi:hypothetical protein